MIKKTVGIIVLSAIVATGIIGCRRTALEQPQQELSRSMQKVQYETNTRQNSIRSIGLNNTGIDMNGDRLFFSRDNTMTQNNITYIDITPYIALAGDKEQDDARKMNTSRMKKNKITGKHNPIPLFTVNLPNSTSFVEYDDKNTNILYVKDAPRENVTVDVPIQILNKDRILMTRGKVYVPVSTLQKIVNVKTATNPKRLKIEIKS